MRLIEDTGIRNGGLQRGRSTSYRVGEDPDWWAHANGGVGSDSPRQPKPKW